MRRPEEERFWEKVEKTDSCWKWKAYISAEGYGMFTRINGGPICAHRYTYLALRGPIPEGFHLDHLCRNRWCVNPFHLEAVTRKENILRGVGFAAINARKTHCVRGHAFTSENTYLHRGERHCRKCICILSRRHTILSAAVERLMREAT
jgi:hypothetical protein